LEPGAGGKKRRRGPGGAGKGGVGGGGGGAGAGPAAAQKMAGRHRLRCGRVGAEALPPARRPPPGAANHKPFSAPGGQRNKGVGVKQLPLGAWQVEAKFGYMEQPDVPAALRACEPFGLSIDPRQASYFMGRRAIRISARSSMPFWQQRLFIMLANQSSRATGYFRIPPDRVVELGMQLSV